MFCKLENNGQYEYHAIVSLKINQLVQEMTVYGQWHCIVPLASGQTFEYTFEKDEWREFNESYLQGGAVLNEYRR